MPDIIEEAWKRRQQEQKFQQQQQKKDNDTIKKTLNTTTIPLHKVKQRNYHYLVVSLSLTLFFLYSVPGYQ